MAEADEIVYYGPYDCVHNSVIFLLNLHGYSLQPIYAFNWDISFDPRGGKLKGTISNEELFFFLCRCYRIRTKLLAFDHLPEHEHFLAVINLFDIPGNEYYLKADQDHCAVVRFTTANTVEVISPYFRIREQVSVDTFYQSWNKYRDLIVSFSFPSAVSDPLSPIKPYLSSKDGYEQQYDKAFRFADSLAEACRLKGDRFNRYFGMLQSIYKAREAYFRNVMEANYSGKILGGWISVQKRAMRLMTSNTGSIYDVLKQALSYELEYIRMVDSTR